jgi:tRNA A37 N6-isopentenylltransferase MiaA
VGYKEVLGHLASEYDLDKALEMTMRASRMLAKQQRTWYRRFADINWLAGGASDLDVQAVGLCRQRLSLIAP